MKVCLSNLKVFALLYLLMQFALHTTGEEQLQHPDSASSFDDHIQKALYTDSNNFKHSASCSDFDLSANQCFSTSSPGTQMSLWKGVDESEKLTGTVRVKKRTYDHVAIRSA